MQTLLLELGELRKRLEILRGDSVSAKMEVFRDLEITYNPDASTLIRTLTSDGKALEEKIKRIYESEKMKTECVDQNKLVGLDEKDQEVIRCNASYMKRRESDIPIICSGCYKWNPGNFMRCSRCKSACYCSRECQVRDWSMHKKKCVKVCTAIQE